MLGGLHPVVSVRVLRQHVVVIVVAVHGLAVVREEALLLLGAVLRVLSDDSVGWKVLVSGQGDVAVHVLLLLYYFHKLVILVDLFL